jgi:hypothetical protein
VYVAGLTVSGARLLVQLCSRQLELRRPGLRRAFRAARVGLLCQRVHQRARPGAPHGRRLRRRGRRDQQRNRAHNLLRCLKADLGGLGGQAGALLLDDFDCAAVKTIASMACLRARRSRRAGSHAEDVPTPPRPF